MNIHLIKNNADFIRKSALFFSSILFFNYSIIFSQDCSYRMTFEVIDLHDSSPLDGARISIQNIDEIGFTDKKGVYKFENLCTDTYFISISHDECQTVKLEIDLNKNINKKVRLEHHFNELDQIMVVSENRNSSRTLFENKISKEVLDSYNSRTLGDVLNIIPGVSSLESGNYLSKPVINGLHSSRVILINNDVRVEDQNWGVEHAPSIDINSADNISVIKGASSLKYAGDAVGGVIVAKTTRPKLIDSIYGNIFSKIQSNGRGGSISANLTKSKSDGWYSKYQATLKKMGDFETPDYIMTNTGFSERNFSIKSGLNRIDYGFDIFYSLFTNEIGILRASHAHTAGDIINAISNQIPNVIENFSYDINHPKQKNLHSLIKLNAFKNFDFGKFKFGYDFQINDRKEYDIRRGDDRDKPASDLNLQTHSISIDLNSKLSDKSNLKTGILVRYQKNFPDPDTGIRRIIPDYKKYDFSLYSVFDYTISDDILFESGLRYDYSHINAYKYYRTSFWESRNYDELFPEIVVEDLGTQILTNPKFNFNNISTNVGIKFNLGSNNILNFNYSLSSRNPNPSELFSEGLHHSAARIEIGDLRFGAETGNNFALTYDINNDNYSFTANTFVNYINNYIYIVPTDLMPTIRGVFPVWEYLQDDAKLIGLDLKYDRRYFSNFFIGHQFSIIKGYERDNNRPLINMPPVNLKNQISFSIPELNNLNLSLESEYVFRQNEYPNYNFEVFIPTEEIYTTLDTSTPPSAYHLLNFASSIGFKSENGGNYKVNLRIENLLNKLYKNYLNRLRYFTHEMGRNIMLSVGYSY